MKRRRHTPEQIIRKLRAAERLIGEGKTIAEAANELGDQRADLAAGGARRARAATIAASPARLRRSARDDGRASPTTMQV
jgi:hypothetical protein